MQSVTVFLAFTCFCLEVHHVYCKICPVDQYTIVNSNGSFERCLSCDTCHPGWGSYPLCGTQLTNERISEISCKVCPSGTFSAELDSSPCKNCQQCAPHEIASASCTRVSDTSCNKTCDKGYFFVEVSHSCQQCSYCCFDKKDEPQPECIKHGFNATGQYCGTRLDKTCTPVHPTTRTTFSTTVTQYHDKSAPPATSGNVTGDTTKSSTRNTTTIVLGVLASIFVTAPIFGFLCWRIRRERQRVVSGINDRDTAEGALNDTSYSSQGPTQSDSSTVMPSRTVTTLQANSGYAPSSPEESPCPTDDELGELRDQKDKLRKKRISKQQISKEAGESRDSASESLLGSREEDSGEKKGQDKNDVGQAMTRRPSLVETAIRKLSKDRYQPLLGEDPDEKNGNVQMGARKFSLPITNFKPMLKRTLSGNRTRNKENLQDPKKDDGTKIAAKPFKVVVQSKYRSSTVEKEGSRVEFKCDIPGETKARYQWFKDDSKIQGQRNSSLVLDPVKVEDFGNYKCEVKYDDGDSVKCVTSLPAELDIVPSDGMELKCLGDVDLNIIEEVGNLLTKKQRGTRTWMQLAIKYKMEKHKIFALENNLGTAGKEVIEFLTTSNPKLTVYDFCKNLKEENIWRLDIVEVLSAHLSATISCGDVRV